MKRDKIIATAPLIIFGLLVVILAVSLHHNTTATKAALAVGAHAPATDLPVLGQRGTRFTVTSMRGRPYVVNFFASWNENCKTEHEELMTLAAGQVPVIGITYKDKADSAAAFLDRAGNPFIAVAQDDKGTASADWGVAGAPETFIIDAYGIVRWHHVGALTASIVSDELMPVWETVQRGG